jgi:hypothetical protein
VRVSFVVKLPDAPFICASKKELVEKLDEFRFTHRFESRTQTTHWLLEHALSQNPKPKK